MVCFYLLLGNMFSSCRGHLFDWSLSSAGEQEPEDVIRYACSDWLKCQVTIFVIASYHSVNHLIRLMTSSTPWRLRCVTGLCGVCYYGNHCNSLYFCCKIIRMQELCNFTLQKIVNTIKIFAYKYFS